MKYLVAPQFCYPRFVPLEFLQGLLCPVYTLKVKTEDKYAIIVFVFSELKIQTHTDDHTIVSVCSGDL